MWGPLWRPERRGWGERAVGRGAPDAQWSLLLQLLRPLTLSLAHRWQPSPCRALCPLPPFHSRGVQWTAVLRRNCGTERGPQRKQKMICANTQGASIPAHFHPKPKWEQPTESHQLRPWWKREVADGQAWRVRSRNVTTCPRPGGTCRPQHTPAQRPD